MGEEDRFSKFALCHQHSSPGPSPGFSSRGGQKPEGRATFLKYSIGCM